MSRSEMNTLLRFGSIQLVCFAASLLFRDTFSLVLGKECGKP